MVRAGGVLAGRDDGEVDLVVTAGDDARAELGRDLGLGASHERDLTRLQLRRDHVDGCARGGERVDLGRVLHHSQRTDDVDRPPELRTGELREQLDEEARPHLVADRDMASGPDQPGDDRRRIFGLLPRTQVEDTRLRLDARRLERGTIIVASASRGTTSIVSRSSGIA